MNAPAPPDLPRMTLEEAAAALAAQRLPPVDQWTPAHDSDSRMEIRADGSWWHDGGPIARPALVCLFAGILRREDDGRHALVTPHERQFIAVADTPFRAVEMRSIGAGTQRRLIFRLDTDTLVQAGPDHVLTFGHDASGQPSPLLHVRGAPGRELMARIVRPLYYELVELALADDADDPAIWSAGARFALAGSGADPAS